MDPPHDILMEILTRLPQRHVGKLRVLSKACTKATHQSYFKDLHAQRQPGPILDGFLLQSLKNNTHIISYVPSQNRPRFDFSLSFLPGHHPQIRAVAPNGLLLCETKHPKRNLVPIYCICKPATQQWMRLPIPKTRYFTKVTAMTVLRLEPLHFKIVRLSQDEMPPKHSRSKGRELICELFDSETWTWKRLQDVGLPDSQFLYSRYAGVWASGSVHWPIADKTIFAFHFDSENWSRIALPDPIRTNYSDESVNSSIKLAEYEGKLAVMHMVDGDHQAAAPSMEVWVMEQYRKKTWSKRLVLPMEEHLHGLPMAFYSSDIAVEWNSPELIFYNFEHGSCNSKTMHLSQRHIQTPKIFPFWSDFEPFSFVDPPRRLSPRTTAKILRKRLRLLISFYCLLSITLLNSFTSHHLETLQY